jgi:hypothetical protein
LGVRLPGEVSFVAESDGPDDTSVAEPSRERSSPRTQRNRLTPSMSSIVKKSWSPADASSYSVVRCGCEMSASARNSRLKRTSDAASTSRSVFNATTWLRSRSSAW